VTNPYTMPSPERIDPTRFTLVLEEAGWRLVGGRRGIYNRLAPPGLEDSSGFRGALVVPLDKEAPEFNSMMVAAIREVSLAATGDIWQRVIEPRIMSSAADRFEFRKQTAVPAGLIPWKEGEELIESARRTMTAGAKSYVQKMRRFSNKLGQFSGRFLDSLLMGQTAVGSYIVTAYAPTDTEIPVFSTSPVGTGAFTGRTARGREVTTAVAGALEATAEALSHYHNTASLSAFEAGIERGISYELSAALHDLAQNSDGSDITILWEEAADLFGALPPSKFVFTAADAPVLERAAISLGNVVEQVSRVTVMGRVHLLTKKALGGPGVFGLETISGPARKVRVRLRDPEGYHSAVKAHDEDLVLAVDGQLERDGNLSWLYDAEVLGEVGRVDEITSRLAEMPPAESTGQLSFDDL
jgi:hypothetical protein